MNSSGILCGDDRLIAEKRATLTCLRHPLFKGNNSRELFIMYNITSDSIRRFLDKVDILGRDDCWEWNASRNSLGYGCFTAPHSKWVKAHRYSFEMFKGEIPNGLCVCHSCDNPPCVNPIHLWLGTLLDNHKDMRSKGRWVSEVGENAFAAKLTDEEVRAIRRDYISGKGVQMFVRKYNISTSLAQNIVTRRSWKHLD